MIKQKIIKLFKIFLNSLKNKYSFRKNYSKEFSIFSNIKNYSIYSSFILGLLNTQKNKNSKILKFFNKEIRYTTRDNQEFFLSLYSFLPKEFAWNSYLKNKIFNLKKNSVIVDVGAHFGFFGCRGAYLEPNFKWYLIECDPNNFSILKKNAECANNKNIVLSNNAITDKKNLLEFIVGNSSTTGSIKKSNFYLQNSKDIINITSTTLENFIETYNIKEIDLLKVDIEGSEYIAFEDNLNIFKNVKSVIFELHMCNNILPENTKLYKYLKSNFNTIEKFPSQNHGRKLLEIYGTKI